MGRVRIGTSGWCYGHWKGVFYPVGVPPRGWLEHYAREFDTVEVNATFYRLPAESTFAGWREGVPEGFMFALKASRPITHFKKLLGAGLELERFLSRARLLEDRLGPLLFQLPPRWHVDVERLRRFLALLPRQCRCAFEFRDESWLTEAVYGALRDHGAALVRVSAPGMLNADVMTAEFCYARMHGDQTMYSSKYSERMLNEWAEAVCRWAAAGKDVFVYFNNDVHGYAVEDARALRELVVRQC